MSFIDLMPSDQQDSVYEPPTVERLGTLAELTLGGDVGVTDATGGAAGDQGSLA